MILISGRARFREAKKSRGTKATVPRLFLASLKRIRADQYHMPHTGVFGRHLIFQPMSPRQAARLSAAIRISSSSTCEIERPT